MENKGYKKMIKKIVPLVIASILAAGCSGGPSESELTTVIEKEAKDSLPKQIEAMKPLAAFSPDIEKEVTRMTGLLDPKSKLVKEIKIEEQTKKENGDFVSKVTMVLFTGNEDKKVSMRITTTVVDGHLKTIPAEEQVL